jgi:hypothetical protein
MSCGDERFGRMIAVDDEVEYGRGRPCCFESIGSGTNVGVKKFEFMIAGTWT